MLVQLAPDTRVTPTRQITSADGESPQSAVITMSTTVTATPQNNIKIKKRLTTFALVIALMTGSVAQLAVLLYRGARIIVVSSLSFAGENGLVAWEQDRLQQTNNKNRDAVAINRVSVREFRAGKTHARLTRTSSHLIDSVPGRRTLSCACAVPMNTVLLSRRVL